MKIKTSELSGAALDWAVAKIEGKRLTGASWKYLRDTYGEKCIRLGGAGSSYSPSTDWSQGGPIIEREGVELICNLTPAEAEKFKTQPHWRASKRRWSVQDVWYGPTPLTAAMRCYVASKLGDEVDVPDELAK